MIPLSGAACCNSSINRLKGSKMVVNPANGYPGCPSVMLGRPDASHTDDIAGIWFHGFVRAANSLGDAQKWCWQCLEIENACVYLVDCLVDSWAMMEPFPMGVVFKKERMEPTL